MSATISALEQVASEMRALNEALAKSVFECHRLAAERDALRAALVLALDCAENFGTPAQDAGVKQIIRAAIAFPTGRE